MGIPKRMANFAGCWKVVDNNQAVQFYSAIDIPKDDLDKVRKHGLKMGFKDITSNSITMSEIIGDDVKEKVFPNGKQVDYEPAVGVKLRITLSIISDNELQEFDDFGHFTCNCVYKVNGNQLKLTWKVGD